MMLLTRVIDNYEGTDPPTIAKSSERGDVVEVVPNTHEFSPFELTSPDWIIFRIPITRAEAEAMKARENPENETPTSRRRAFHLNLDTLISLGYTGIPTVAEATIVRNRWRQQARDRGIGESEAKHLLENARSVSTVDVTAAHFDAAKTRKPTILDPTIIG